MVQIDIIQFKQHADPVCRLLSAQLHKQIVDRQDRRREKRFLRYFRQIFLKEQPRTAVRKNKSQAADFCSVFGIKQGCDLI